jgi:hypothetical protein
MSDPKSLLLVTVDCLRADHIGFMGYPQPTTPFLDQLAAESMVFPKAIAAACAVIVLSSKAMFDNLGSTWACVVTSLLLACASHPGRVSPRRGFDAGCGLIGGGLWATTTGYLPTIDIRA